MEAITRTHQEATTAQIYPINSAIRGDLTPTTYYHDFFSFLDVSDKSTETYTRNLNKFSDYMTENRITRPTRDDILRYRDYLTAKGLKATTVKAYIQVVKLFFEWLDTNGMYANVATHVKTKKISKNHKRGYLSVEQCRELIKEIDADKLEGKRNKAICMLMITCALRCIEVSRANIEDLRTLGADTVLFVQGKGRDDKGEFVKVPPQAERAIRDYLEARAETDISAPLFATCSKNYHGERISTRSISKICKNSMKAIGLNRSDLTAHSFRHTGVSLSLFNGQELRDVSKYARHADISTTEIYDHEIDTHNNTCSEAVAAAIFA